VSHAFVSYYQDELAYLRELGREFAQAHPQLAPMLAERSGDPDVERLLEGVAFLTGRLRQKLDDELPQAIQGIAELVCPDFLRPTPAAAILELLPLPNVLRERVTVPAGAEFSSVEVDGTRCIFRSSVACELSPWTIENVRVQQLPGGTHELAIDMRVPLAIPVAMIAPDKLRLHFAGDTRTSLGLLMWTHTSLEDVAVVTAAPDGAEREVRLGKHAIGSVGFDESEGLLPRTPTSFHGQRLVAEYNHLPSKFAFVDVAGVRRVAEVNAKAARFTISMRFSAPPPADLRVTKDSVKLHCVPIVNVFETTAEPLDVTPKRGEYLLRPAGLSQAQGGVYAITKVEMLEAHTGLRTELPSFFDFSHAGSPPGRTFYSTYIRPSVVGEGADMLISFGTARDAGAFAEGGTVAVDLLATNRGLSRALRPGEISVATASSPAVATFKNLSAPTPFVPPAFGKDLQWRVVAHAAMNLLSITDPKVLRAALDVYDARARVDAQSARATELRLAAITDVGVVPASELFKGAPVRGAAITVDLADSGFAGAGDMFLFGAILERLFASYVSINSFSRVNVRGTPSGLRFQWPARSGSQTLI
jgi:type VI secretion system protein ImpG